MFLPTLYRTCDYWSMLWLKLIHISKRAFWRCGFCGLGTLLACTPDTNVWLTCGGCPLSVVTGDRCHIPARVYGMTSHQWRLARRATQHEWFIYPWFGILMIEKNYSENYLLMSCLTQLHGYHIQALHTFRTVTNMILILFKMQLKESVC